VYKLGIMEVPETLSRPIQLLSHFSEGICKESAVTYQFQSVDLVGFNVVHDGPVSHPI